MDLEIKHLGQTLAVGGFAVYGLLLLVRICRASWVPKFFDASDGKLQLQHAAVYLALVLATGVLLEDVSKNYSSQRASFLTSLLNRVLDTDNELRFRSLFKVEAFHANEIKAKPRSIFRELEKTHPRHPAVSHHYETIKQQINTPAPDDISIRDPRGVVALKSAIDGIYYDAKNRVYREQSYYHELSEISDRIDFTRALTFLCLAFFIIYLAFGLLAFNARAARFLDIDQKERSTVLTLSVLYALGIGIAGTAFRSESNNYDLRVFGYYISLVMEPEKPLPPPTKGG